LKMLQKYASELGFVVNAGHGLNYQNVSAIAKMPYFYEFNIGHSIVSRAVLIGMKEAVRDMKEILYISSNGENG